MKKIFIIAAIALVIIFRVFFLHKEYDKEFTYSIMHHEIEPADWDETSECRQIIHEEVTYVVNSKEFKKGDKEYRAYLIEGLMDEFLQKGGYIETYEVYLNANPAYILFTYVGGEPGVYGVVYLEEFPENMN